MGPTVTLNNGITMPRVGFGVFQVDEKSCEEAVLEALQAGYRLIDTARAYNNEAAVGRAVRRSGLKREELFITSKAFVQDMSFAGAKRALDETLSALQTDYIDLYLIHMPYGDYYSAWRSLEEEYVQEKIRALGVSNFLPDRLLDLVHNVKVIPAVNQIAHGGKAYRRAGVGPLCRGLKRHVQQSRAQGNRGGPSGVGSAGHSALGFTARRVRHSQVGAQGAHGGKPGFRALCLK